MLTWKYNIIQKTITKGIKIIFEYENPDYKIQQNLSMNQYNRASHTANSLNRHKIKNVIGRKSVLLSQIQESKIDPNQEAHISPNFSNNPPRINKSSFVNSFNQSNNESFQRRNYNHSTNRGNNTTLGGNAHSNEFKTMLIMINVDRFVFGYVTKMTQ